ncbi:NUDIX domain-containing protein [Ditylenchus destructor]|nr:NUDIX domain-containing protein [Ditylenchus destructor]
MCSSARGASTDTPADSAVAVNSNGTSTPKATVVKSLTTVNHSKSAESKRIRDLNGYRQRAAGLCARFVTNGEGGEDRIEILLISGRGQKNYWVLPGGGVEQSESAEEAVLREFREEAGIQGAVICIVGEFTNDERFHHTSLYLLSVIEIYDQWEDYEHGRQRRWMPVDEALTRIKCSQIPMIEQGLNVILAQK